MVAPFFEADRFTQDNRNRGSKFRAPAVGKAA
jgi:hypothetical protein